MMKICVLDDCDNEVRINDKQGPSRMRCQYHEFSRTCQDQPCDNKSEKGYTRCKKHKVEHAKGQGGIHLSRAIEYVESFGYTVSKEKVPADFWSQG